MTEADGPLVAASLFSGIGGIERGLELAGIPTVFQCEIDPAARRVLAHHWPTVTRAGDVQEVTADDIRAAAPRGARFVLSAGFPCQDVSVAGRRAGVAEGTRSGLYVEVVRLAEELDPDWLVVENVPGLLTADVDPDVNGGAECAEQRRRSHRKCEHSVRPATRSPHGYGAGTAFQVVLRDLTGYMPPIPDGGWRSSGICVGPRRTAAWRVLDAQYFGVAQRRRRVFVVCHARDRAAPGAVLLEPEGMRWDPAPRRASWQGAAAAAARGAVRDRAAAADRGRADDPRAERVTFGLGEDGDTARALATSGGGRWEDTAETYIAETAATLQGGGRRGYRVDAEGAAGGQLIAAPTTAAQYGYGQWTPLAFHVTQDPISGDVAPAMGTGNGQGCSTIGVFTKTHRAADPDDAETWIPSDTAPCVDAGGHGPRTATAIVAPPNPDVESLAIRGAADGSGADVHSGGDQSFALRSARGPGGGQALARVDSAVRRLTPRECERLQAFPDDWTLVPGTSDSSRYRELGNAVCCNVSEWQAHRIVAYEAQRAR